MSTDSQPAEDDVRALVAARREAQAQAATGPLGVITADGRPADPDAVREAIRAAADLDIWPLKLVVVWCDRECGQEAQADVLGPGDAIAALRAALTGRGWRITEGADVCPACAHHDTGSVTA